MTQMKVAQSTRVQGTVLTKAAQWSGAGALFLGISRGHQWITPLGQLQAPAVLSVTALVLLFAASAKWKPGDLFKHWLSIGVFTICIIAFIGISTSIYPGKSLAFFNESYSRTILLFIVGWAIARTAEGARFLARVLAAAGILAAALAIRYGRHDDVGRLSGAFTYDPNDISFVCILTLPIAMWWMIEKRYAKSRWAMVPSLGILIYVIIESGSRGAFLGLAATAVGLVLLTRGKLPKKVKSFARVAIMLAIAGIPLLPGDYVARIQTIGADDDYNQDSPTGRIEVWKRGIGYAWTHPLTGVGIGNFETAEGWLSPQGIARKGTGVGWKWSTAHNSFVQVLAELGLIAGTLFPVLVIRIVVAMWRWHGRRAPGEPEDSLPSFVGLVFLCFCVSGMFLSFAYYDIVYAYIALAAGLLNPLRERRAAVPARAVRRDPRTTFGRRVPLVARRVG